MKLVYKAIFCLLKLNLFLGYAWLVTMYNIDIGITIFLGVILLYCVEKLEDEIYKRVN